MRQWHQAAFPASLLSVLWLLAPGACGLPPERPVKAVSDLPTVAAASQDLRPLDGLARLHLDEAGGRVLLEIPAPAGPRGLAAQYLFLEGLRTGVGHNTIGLDRGQMGDARLLEVRRLGRRVLFEEPNLRFRALAGDDASQRAARESFATSVLWGGTIEALDGDGRALLDITSFLLRDAHGVADALRRTGQGRFQIAPDRSLVDVAASRAFPDNLEFEAQLTFTSDEPGSLVRSTVPAPGSVTVVQHLSLVRLPDDGYRPLRHDPRAGANAVRFQDMTAPLTGSVVQWLATRHRMTAVNPDAPRSRVIEPIVYYVDTGAPGAVRDALLEGAEWWADAFDAAGFVDAFRVQLLPPDIDPLDVRYNVIQWVHRSSRGWSYGNSIVDPRTGEIIKGHVSLGSLRIRQDRLLFEGLLGTQRSGDGSAADPLELALARIRQLAAHEVGHTLGLAHNFAASSVRNGSVMDYPAPDVVLGADGELDTSRAYGVGVGPWDRSAIFWLYSQVEDDSPEQDLLRTLIGQAQDEIPFLSDEDARPAGAAHPLANLWDNGADPVQGLANSLAVRRHALERFTRNRIAAQRPLAELEEVFATVYFHHRYQLTAALKVIGGLEYTHALRDGGTQVTRPTDNAWQERALAQVLLVLDPTELDVTENVLELMHPRPPGWQRHRELPGSRAQPAFDSLELAASAARQVVAGLLQAQRCTRLVDVHRRLPHHFGLEHLLSALQAAAFSGQPRGLPAPSPRHAALREIVQRVVVEGLVDLTLTPRANSLVRSAAEQSLARIEGALAEDDTHHALALRTDIRRFLERPAADALRGARAAQAPPGSPIGSINSPGFLGGSMDGSHLGSMSGPTPALRPDLADCSLGLTGDAPR